MLTFLDWESPLLSYPLGGACPFGYLHHQRGKNNPFLSFSYYGYRDTANYAKLEKWRQSVRLTRLLACTRNLDVFEVPVETKKTPTICFTSQTIGVFRLSSFFLFEPKTSLRHENAHFLFAFLAHWGF